MMRSSKGGRRYVCIVSAPVAATADEELALEELSETVDGKESVDELKARDEKRR